VLLEPEYASSLAASERSESASSWPGLTEKNRVGDFFAPSSAHRKKRFSTHELTPGCSTCSYKTASGRSDVGGYGPLPDSAAQPLTDAMQLAQATVWRGHRIDPTGLYYLGARYYEPTSGRFLSCDPLSFAAGTSLYAFCGGDCVNYFDPDGRKFHWENLGRGIAGVAGGIVGSAILVGGDVLSGGTATPAVLVGGPIVAGSFSYGIGNLVATLPGVSDKDAAMMAGSPSSPAQLIARGVGGEPAQNAVGVVEGIVELNGAKTGLEITKAAVETADADKSLIDSLNKDQSTTPESNPTPSGQGSNADSQSGSSNWQGVPYKYDPTTAPADPVQGGWNPYDPNDYQVPPVKQCNG
jgi:RHS repeat-associated protein